jgi:hypothetical protein
MKLSVITGDAEAAIREYVYETRSLEFARKALSSRHVCDLEFIIGGHECIGGVSEPLDIEAYDRLRTKIASLMIGYLENTVARAKAELEQFGIEVDV